MNCYVARVNVIFNQTPEAKRITKFTSEECWQKDGSHKILTHTLVRRLSWIIKVKFDTVRKSNNLIGLMYYN